MIYIRQNNTCVEKLTDDDRLKMMKQNFEDDLNLCIRRNKNKYCRINCAGRTKKKETGWFPGNKIKRRGGRFFWQNNNKWDVFNYNNPNFMNQYCRDVTHQQDREVGVILPFYH
jgi:hypothetical protein